MKSSLPLIIGMLIVTYIPRFCPFWILSQKTISPSMRKFLFAIPYTALGVLIVRGVAESSSEMVIPTLAGIGTAAIFSWFGRGLIFSVLAAIFITYVTLCLS
ncbi:MAG: AzlD domain-containing protein [Aminobacterium sp.]|jgi:branched-subunit amino acid transport protein|uniref:Branched-chain amino acid transport protein (AzlD) n=1 Tax=bioreactor metagenome TaxID=1076179 RepID=A0A645CV34_9ZZZZ|nr:MULTISPECIES: AzlD domain-containing protein [unclassified Aminobacterium]MDD2206041.1 AzlD domain-containing protein [Aminobacterium sp.]MDD3425613.1 AzlD domain-containing protein [Aminobacterium sp.]MDD3708032.1 AzlD domain-containing protein [Aminobacterium sp.]MDD4227802.1 AzlD domain-containing protein [Aminobacterium sp.]MDD4550758.1 AzlD domain-containing protein [Aminobacterium sp.]